jgi:hypothetical protein
MLNKILAEARKSGQKNVRQKNEDYPELAPIFLSYIFLSCIFLSALSSSSDATIHLIAIVTKFPATLLRVICTSCVPDEMPTGKTRLS